MTTMTTTTYTEHCEQYTATAGPATRSTCCPDRSDALDCAVTLHMPDGREARFGVTLLRDRSTDGAYSSWGERANWLSGEGEAALDELEGADYEAATLAIEWAAQSACEAFQD